MRHDDYGRPGGRKSRYQGGLRFAEGVQSSDIPVS